MVSTFNNKQRNQANEEKEDLNNNGKPVKVNRHVQNTPQQCMQFFSGVHETFSKKDQAIKQTLMDLKRQKKVKVYSVTTM